MLRVRLHDTACDPSHFSHYHGTLKCGHFWECPDSGVLFLIGVENYTLKLDLVQGCRKHGGKGGNLPHSRFVRPHLWGSCSITTTAPLAMNIFLHPCGGFDM